MSYLKNTLDKYIFAPLFPVTCLIRHSNDSWNKYWILRLHIIISRFFPGLLLRQEARGHLDEPAAAGQHLAGQLADWYIASLRHQGTHKNCSVAASVNAIYHVGLMVELQTKVLKDFSLFTEMVPTCGFKNLCILTQPLRPMHQHPNFTSTYHGLTPV